MGVFGGRAAVIDERLGMLIEHENHSNRLFV